MHIERGRFGQFLLLVGLVLMGIFFATDQSQNPQYIYFCGGALAVLGGGYAWWRAFTPPAESARFRRIRKWRQAQEEKKKAPKK